MKTPRLFFLACLLICPAIGRAEGLTSVEINLVPSVQLHPTNYSVQSFRWDIIYGVNEDVQGLDLGFVNYAYGGEHGVELGLFNQVDKDFGGLQLSLLNQVKRHAKGVQIGALANVDGLSFDGLQAAVFYNGTEEQMHGLQVGLINHAGSLYGIQIGLLNFSDDSKYVGFLPFINAAF